MYLELVFQLHEPAEDHGEILAAFLNQLDYETAQENNSLKAYKADYSINEIEEELTHMMSLGLCENHYSINEIEKINWNKEWETHFSPVIIPEICYIRAHFHPAREKEKELEIIITPKMSFGTGHHATTALMISALSEMNLQKLRCLDMGTGTGVLAIYAAKKGANSVLAIDNDEWCAINTLENIEVNKVSKKIDVIHGDAYHLLNESPFDLIIANINRNILLQDMEVYVGKLKKGGSILFSGFHPEDIPIIVEKATKIGLLLQSQKEKDNWVCIKLSLASKKANK